MDSLFIFGGSNESGLLKDVWVFDLYQLKWARIQAKGQEMIPRTNHKAVVLSGGK